jgi:hypothetical protein
MTGSRHRGCHNPVTGLPNFRRGQAYRYSGLRRRPLRRAALLALLGTTNEWWLPGPSHRSLAEGPRGYSGDVLDVVGNESGLARAEQLVQVFHGVRELGRGSSPNSSPGELMWSGVLEVDRTPAHPGDDLDLLARGQGLRTGEKVALPDVTVLGEGDCGERATSAGSTKPIRPVH